jgi:hypothetical protein
MVCMHAVLHHTAAETGVYTSTQLSDNRSWKNVHVVVLCSSIRQLTFSTAHTCAPALSSMSTTLASPLAAALCSGVCVFIQYKDTCMQNTDVMHQCFMHISSNCS